MPEAGSGSSALLLFRKGPWEIRSDSHKERAGEVQTLRNESMGGQTAAAFRLVKNKTSQSSKKKKKKNAGRKRRRGWEQKTKKKILC